MEYREEEFLMLSGIQHFAFCRRQWALIHIEQQWAENERTVEGELVHKRAHDPYLREKRGDVLISRNLPVFSRTLGISGICDIVEFHRSEEGAVLHGHRGLFQIYPVEYKKGAPKESEADILQLTAQAMCLEEMMMTEIREGALYYAQTRRRESEEITEDLRQSVRKILLEMHDLYRKKYTPRVKWSKSCNACSLRDLCLPRLGKSPEVHGYIQRKITEE
ncbi:MAG: CRISPR-associated protein Cas4 [Eubacteriales bacterium]|nr:CRISPR-associated protein Cas4 [Eubacteriales bacterium]